MDDLKAISEQLAGVEDLKALLEGLFVHAPVSLQIYGVDGRSLLVNPTFRRLFGSEPPPEYSIFDDDILARQGFTELVRRAFAGETIALPPIWYDPRELQQLEIAVGRRVGVEVSMFPLRDRGGVVRHVALAAKDVTSELDLAVREERLRLAFSAGRMIAWDTNLTARTVHVSDNAREILGLLPQTPLATIADTLAIIHVDDRAVVDRALSVANDGGGSPDRRFRVVRPIDGELRWFERRATVSFDATTNMRWLRGILMDVTARVAGEAALKASEAALRRAEEQLRQSQKLEAVGRLAGGIAHDFNNILSVILSYGDLLLGDLPASDPRREDVAAIRDAGARAAELTRQLLAFSRQQVLTLTVLDLNDIVRSSEHMLRRLLGENIELTVRPSREAASIRADAGQLDQVIVNLAINARDAMPDGGKLTIETKQVLLDEAYARQHLGVVPGNHVMLAVSDTGVGMDREVQDRIFEPFFTTKERGKGTGLGLSTVLGIVQQTGGSIWVYSEPGKGTAFKVFFPRTEPAAQPSAPVASPLTLRGSETVLLVEDQDDVRRVACEVLRRYGYDVVEAASAAEAISAAAREGRPIDLLLTDVVMPHMSGRELAEDLVRERPALRVLFMSGYTEDAILQHRILESGFAYLQKPLVPETLARRVREVLDGPVGPGIRP